MTTIDSSLAKGLTKRFTREYDKNTLELLDYTRREFSKITTKKRWKRFVEKVWRYDSVIINKYFGGSRRQPYLCISFLEKGDFNPMEAINEQGEFDANKGWLEDVLIHSFLIFQFNTDRTTPREVLAYVISHHVIQRLFQRCLSLNIESGDVTHDAILREMQHINFWSSVWNYFKAYIEISDIEISFDDLSFPIPGYHGLFFALQPSVKSCLFVRTYVEDEKLSMKQIETKNLLLDASSDLFNSPICYFPEIERACIEGNCALIFDLILHRLSGNKKIICDQITRKCESTTLKNRFHDAMTKVIADHQHSDLSKMDEAVSKYGQRTVLLHLKKIRGF